MAEKRLPDDRAAADAALVGLRNAAAARGATIEPEFWTFTGTWDVSALVPEEYDAASFQFDSRSPRGRILHIRRFGWRTPHDPGRRAIPVVSLGEPMADILDCFRLGIAATLPELEPMKAALRRWSRCILDGTLPDELIRFYSELHDQYEPSWRAADESGFEKFRNSLLEVLNQRAGIVAFYPQKRGEFPGYWMTLVGNSTSQTGRVRRVIQPGLLDAERRLITPARVEVE